MPNYLSAPVKSKSLPKGIPYIIGNEAAIASLIVRGEPSDEED